MSARKEVFHMPWWLWLLISPFLLIALIVLLSHVDSWLSGYKSNVNLTPHKGADTGTLTIYLPGLIADGENVSHTLDPKAPPLADVWLEHGDVMTVSYTGERFDAEHVVNTVTQMILADKHDKYVFVGSSMGGMLTMDIIAQLREAGAKNKIAASSVILVDSPSGPRDMMGGGDIAAPRLRFLPFGKVFNAGVTFLLHRGAVPPKDPNIEPQLNKNLVKSEALAAMRKFSAAIWRDQMAYMGSHAKPRPADFVGLERVIYLRCDLNNETVKQPQASKTWSNATRGMEVTGVESTHCGYLERPRTWNKQFGLIMARVARSH